MQTSKQGVFYSNGDWGIQKLMFAVSWLVVHPAVTVLLLPCVDVYFCRHLVDWLRKNWSYCLIIATKEDCRKLIATELSGYESQVAYVWRKNLDVSMYARYNENNGFCISCPIALKGNGSFSQFNYLLNCDEDMFMEVLSPVVSLFSTKMKRERHKKHEKINEFLDRKFFAPQVKGD
jgi:hypothetical protein